MADMSVNIRLLAHDAASKKIKSVENQLRALDRVEKNLNHPSTKAQLAAAERVRGTRAGGMGIGGAISARMAGVASPAVAAYAGAKAYGDFAEMERSLTRTGLKLGASREAMADMRAEMGQIADRYAVPIQEVMSAFDALAESGFDFSAARSSLDGVVKATQGLGGAGGDTVATFDAARKSIGLAANESERFFDIIAAGGASGKFEGSDLARYLPSLLPVAARQGYEGLEGAARLVGFLEVMRDYVGSSEEAATATQDIFEKISSPDVIKNFKKVGIDLEKRLGKARESGEDVLLVLADIIKEATKGDASQLSKLFGDRDSRRAANVLLTAIDRVKAAQEELRTKSGGTIEYNVKVLTEDAQANIDRLATNWEKLKTNIGSKLSVVISPVLESVNQGFSDDDAYYAGLKKVGGDEIGANKDFIEEHRRRYPDAGGVLDEQREQDWKDAIRAIGRGEVDSVRGWFDRKRSRNLAPQMRSERQERAREQPLPPSVSIPPSRPDRDEEAMLAEARRRQAAAYQFGTGREFVPGAVETHLQGSYPASPPPPPASYFGPVAQPPGLDAILDKLSSAVIEKNKLADPITTSADVDLSAFGAKLEQMRSMARSARADVNGILGGISAGGGAASAGDYQSLRRSQPGITP